MKKIKCLAICPSFPPVLSPRSIRLGILTHFFGLGDEVDWDIICAKPETIRLSSLDNRLLFLDSGNQVYRVRSFESRYLRWLSLRFFPFSLLSIPDPRIGWLPAALSKANKLLKTNHYDYLCTFSTPATSHLVALLAKREETLPWLAFMSDPWTNMPINRPFDRVSAQINKKLEQQVFEKADKLVFTWPHGRDWALRDYPERIKRKTEILAHAYDEDLYNLGKIPENLVRSPNKMRFVYAGIFYGLRTPEPLLASLKIIQQQNRGDLDFLEIILLGSKSIPVERLIQKYNLNNIVVATKEVSYFDSLTTMRSADVLVVMDAPMDASPFLPSKLIDYLGANRPILGITPKSGPTAEVLHMCGLPTILPEDPEAIARTILLLKDKWEHNHMDEWLPNPEVVRKFSVQEISKKMLNIFTDLQPIAQ